MRGDLHIHTNVSDGALTPEELARASVESGLGLFSVTDHNSVGALSALQQALPAEAPLFVLGVELSSQPLEGREIHLLGYGVDPDCPALLEACSKVSARKATQLRQIIDRLRSSGVDPKALTLVQDADEGAYLGRPMLAELLVREGVVDSVNQAFGRFLGERAPTYVPMHTFDPRRCIEAIHRAGGLAVLAHPTIRMVDLWIEPLAEAGLDGVEAFRPALSGNAQLYVEKAAEHFDLFVTGGSDWHGRPGERALGEFSVPGELLSDFCTALGCRAGRRS